MSGVEYKRGITYLTSGSDVTRQREGLPVCSRTLPSGSHSRILLARHEIRRGRMSEVSRNRSPVIVGRYREGAPEHMVPIVRYGYG